MKTISWLTNEGFCQGQAAWPGKTGRQVDLGAGGAAYEI